MNMKLMPENSDTSIAFSFLAYRTTASPLALALINVIITLNQIYKNQSHDYSVVIGGLFWFRHFMNTTHKPVYLIHPICIMVSILVSQFKP